MSQTLKKNTYNKFEYNRHIQVMSGGVNHKSSVLKSGIIRDRWTVGQILKKWGNKHKFTMVQLTQNYLYPFIKNYKVHTKNKII